MGWFNKDNKEEKKESVNKVPDLPRLPELPDFDEHYEPTGPIHQLPVFPSNSFGDKFSRRTIKSAVTKEKDINNYSKMNDFKEGEDWTVQMPQRKPQIKESDNLEKERIPKEFTEAARIVKKAEPVFIRIDKFEESLKMFGTAKRQISEIEKTLENINKTRGEEERELQSWESEIKKIKEQIENVEEDIFSKIE